MAILDEKIANDLLSQLKGSSAKEKWETCRNDYPWYPLPWLMSAETDQEKQKAALWFRNEHRIHWLLNRQQVEERITVEDSDNSAAVPEISVMAEPEIPATAEDQPYEGIVSDSMEPTVAYVDDSELAIAVEEPADNFEPEILQEAENMPEALIAQQASEFDAEPMAEQTEQTSWATTDEPAFAEEILQEAENSPEEPASNLATAVSLEQTTELTEESNQNIEEEVFAAENQLAQEQTTTEIAEPSEPKELLPEAQSAEVAIAANAGQTEAVPATEPAKEPTKAKHPLFEPMYTVDYFMSQGIKIDPNFVPITKFDRQVKSFTQWLKSMKKVGPETASVNDAAVDAQASASVAEKDVLTEAMVEVLEKQGKYQKAIETLDKLILLHPEKSAFFAAQIENLKAKQ